MSANTERIPQIDRGAKLAARIGAGAAQRNWRIEAALDCEVTPHAGAGLLKIELRASPHVGSMPVWKTDASIGACQSNPALFEKPEACAAGEDLEDWSVGGIVEQPVCPGSG